MRVVACEWMDGLDADPITSLFISLDMNSSSMVVFDSSIDLVIIAS